MINLAEAEIVPRNERRGKSEPGGVESVALGNVIRDRIELQVFENFRVGSDAARVERLERSPVNGLNHAPRITEAHDALLVSLGRHNARDGR